MLPMINVAPGNYCGHILKTIPFVLWEWHKVMLTPQRCSVAVFLLSQVFYSKSESIIQNIIVHFIKT